MQDQVKNLGMWQRAKNMAEATPAERNRYVDFLRALSISAVVLGHWIIAAPYMLDGSANMDHLLTIQPWSQWLTWVFQVMPIFFFVGGYSNGVSWDSAQRKGQSYSSWLHARLQRLLGPVLPLIFVWTIMAIITQAFGVHPLMVTHGSQISLVPVWFLAIYFVIVTLVPLTRIAWRKFGVMSIVVPLVLAVLGDWIFFNTAYQWFGWFNYLFIWGAVHQLGYAWQAGKLGGLLQSIGLAVIGLVTLIALTQYGIYPTSLVGVPGEAITNTTPPKLPLIALGLAQIGIALSFEGPMRRWLARGRVWTATVLTNGFIMPIYLWHSTVMILLIGATFALLPMALDIMPGTSQWWWHRPIWIGVYLIAMMLVLPLIMVLDKRSESIGKRQVSWWLTLIAGLLICFGLAILAKNGIAGSSLLGINWLAVLMPFIGALLLRVGYRFGSSSASS
ncbi:MAG: acyltransferase [Pseudomonadota bacterium]